MQTTHTDPAPPARTGAPTMDDLAAVLERARVGAAAEREPEPEPPAAQEVEEPEPPSEEAAAEGDPEPAEAPSEEEAPADEEDPLVEVIVQGKVEQVPYSEVLKGYQRQQDYTRKSEQLAADRKRFEEASAQYGAQTADYYARLGRVVEQFEAQVQATSTPAAQAELEELRRSDPAEWTARVWEMQRRQQIAEQARQYQAALMQQEKGRRIPRERTALAEADPDFAKNFDATYREVGRWALSPEGGGLSPDEWNEIFDHRHVLIVKKAMQYDEATRKRAPRTAKKLARLPKPVRPGAQTSPGDTHVDDHKRAMARLEKHHDVQSAAEVFLARERMRRNR